MEDQKPPEPGMALEKVAPKDLKAWINSDQFKSALSQSLPSHMTPDRYSRIVLTAIMRTPKLAQCTQVSLFKSVLDCSSLGLEPDGRRAHLIPYDVKEKGTWKVIRTEAQLIIDYKGLIELSKRSGEVRKWRPELVCNNDEFEYENGMVTKHRIDWRKDRGKPYAVYSYVKNKDGEEDFEVMSYVEVEKIRQRSKAKDNGPWITDYDEMAKKTVMRRHSKRLTLSPEFHEALEKDADRFDDLDASSSFTLEDIVPRSQSEVDAALAAGDQKTVVIPQGDTPQTGEPTQQTTPPAPDENDRVITSESLGKLLGLFREYKLKKEKLDVYVNSVIGVKSIDKLREKDVERVAAWMKNQSSTK